MALIVIDGTSLPVPKRGMTETISTNVDDGRNAQGEMVGERVGRDIYKLDNLEWVWLNKQQWSNILKLVSGFKFHVTFPDSVNGGFCTHLMYCGDRHAEPYYINSNGDFTFYRSCKMNLIDCGIIDD